MELLTVKIEKPDEINLILGQSHFIKTVEDLHEALVTCVGGIKFGLAFCEASGPCLVRVSGTDPELLDLAAAQCPQPRCRPCLSDSLTQRLPDQRPQRREECPRGLSHLLRHR